MPRPERFFPLLASAVIATGLLVVPPYPAHAGGLPGLEPEETEIEEEYPEPNISDPYIVDDYPYHPPHSTLIDAVRFGTFAHNKGRDEDGYDINAQILFNVLEPVETDNAALNILLNPKLHLGGSLNLQGDTSFGYAGATWRAPLGFDLFVEADFGLAVHNGERFDATGARASLGCNWSFREAASVGLNIEAWEFLLTVEHLSNASLCDFNDGLTNFGVRVGRRF